MRSIASRLCPLVAGAILVGAAAYAQAPGPAPNPTAPLVSGPPKTAPDANSTAPPSLSKKLNQSNGVIHPKEVDPGIEKPPPKTGDPNVVPPPGATGGAPAPQPK